MASKITRSARGEQCTIRLPGICNYDTSTTVWCHSNRMADGKGIGYKASEENGAYGCSECHRCYDRQRPRPKNMTLEYVESKFTNAMEESRQILIKKGLLCFEHFCEKPKTVGRLKNK